MATSTQDWRGIVIELDHNETANLLDTLKAVGAGAAGGGIAAALTAMGIAAAMVPYIAAALAAHIAWEVVAIKAMDQGEGVILTMPYFMPGTLIPATRHPHDVNENWATIPDGTFKIAGGDQIAWHIDHNATSHDMVSFRLENQCQSGWDKEFIVRNGEGNDWHFKASRRAGAGGALYARQCANGQQFTFRKPATIGIWIDVISIGWLAPLQGGDAVRFTWLRD